MRAARLVAASVVLVALAVQVSCALMFKGRTAGVSFNSEPGGAQVFVNGELKGLTPVVLELRTDEKYRIELRREGYSPEIVTLTNHIGVGWIILDILFWPFVLVDAATGAWYSFDEENIHSVLLAQNGVPAPEAAPAVAQAPAPAQMATAAMSQQLPRRRIKNDKTRCAAMPLQALSVSADMVKVIDEFVLSELQGVGFEAIGNDDISVMLGFEKTKDAMGCDDASCAAEIGGALGVDYIVAGKVSTLGSAPVLTLKLVDVRNSRVLARSNRTGSGSESGLPTLVAEAVQELVAQSGL